MMSAKMVTLGVLKNRSFFEVKVIASSFLSMTFFFLFLHCFSHFEDIHISYRYRKIYIYVVRYTSIHIFIKTVIHKYKYIQYNIQSQKLIKLVKFVVSFIGKEVAEDCKSCHQVPVASIAVINLLILRNRYVRFQAQVINFSLCF